MSQNLNDGSVGVPIVEQPAAVSVITLWIEHFSAGRVAIRFHVSPPLGADPRNVAQILRQQADQLDEPVIFVPPGPLAN
jgi:hypothetical protein